MKTEPRLPYTLCVRQAEDALATVCSTAGTDNPPCGRQPRYALRTLSHAPPGISRVLHEALTTHHDAAARPNKRPPAGESHSTTRTHNLLARHHPKAAEPHNPPHQLRPTAPPSSGAIQRATADEPYNTPQQRSHPLRPSIGATQSRLAAEPPIAPQHRGRTALPSGGAIYRATADEPHSVA